MNRKEIAKVMDVLVLRYPSTNTTLNNMRFEGNPYKILIACLLSLRVKDEITGPVCCELFSCVKTPEEMLKLDIRRLKRIIFSTGHFNRKADILKSVSREIVERFGGKVPDTYDELMTIKGVGPKTSNIVLAFAFGKSVLPIDVNCHRVANRLGFVRTNGPEETEVELKKVLPRKYFREFNSIMMQFGREFCVGVSPFCSKCPVAGNCLKVGVKKSR